MIRRHSERQWSNTNIFRILRHIRRKISYKGATASEIYSESGRPLATQRRSNCPRSRKSFRRPGLINHGMHSACKQKTENGSETSLKTSRGHLLRPRQLAADGRKKRRFYWTTPLTTEWIFLLIWADCCVLRWLMCYWWDSSYVAVLPYWMGIFRIFYNLHLLELSIRFFSFEK